MHFLTGKVGDLRRMEREWSQLKPKEKNVSRVGK